MPGNVWKTSGVRGPHLLSFAPADRNKTRPPVQPAQTTSSFHLQLLAALHKAHPWVPLLPHIPRGHRLTRSLWEDQGNCAARPQQSSSLLYPNSFSYGLHHKKTNKNVTPHPEYLALQHSLPSKSCTSRLQAKREAEDATPTSAPLSHPAAKSAWLAREKTQVAMVSFKSFMKAEYKHTEQRGQKIPYFPAWDRCAEWTEAVRRTPFFAPSGFREHIATCSCSQAGRCYKTWQISPATVAYVGKVNLCFLPGNTTPIQDLFCKIKTFPVKNF